ncbi:hypothetical protein HZH66_005639 [Vespula vulgaris]|uniref:Uncharacterized protein n=1 Tax=Vespula vulgaris TaxID=7454 RepID=A0A834N886_VESVU|nr:hypothetical protein HZH66_005639 [Vespula vulgaris]
MATPDPVDPATLEIKTRSIEQTLLPLVKQAHSIDRVLITVLLNFTVHVEEARFFHLAGNVSRCSRIAPLRNPITQVATSLTVAPGHTPSGNFEKLSFQGRMHFSHFAVQYSVRYM